MRNPSPVEPDVETLIIGTGFAGLGMAIRMQSEGFTDFVLIEKEPEVGGTWFVNTYPGCACDVPSHMYSFSSSPIPTGARLSRHSPRSSATCGTARTSTNCEPRFASIPRPSALPTMRRCVCGGSSSPKAGTWRAIWPCGD